MIFELKTFLVAMSPIVELRGAIPLAYGVYKMPIWSAYLFSVAGNIVPLIGIIILARPISQWLSERFNFFKKFFDWLFLKVSKKTEKLGILGKDLIVVVLTAIPVPLVGGWTGALASFILEIPAKRGIILVSLGAMTSGIIVSLLTLGIINIIN